MAIITIEKKDDKIQLYLEKLPKARLEWTGQNFQCYLKGSFAKGYNMAANLMLDYAMRKGISTLTIKRVYGRGVHHG